LFDNKQIAVVIPCHNEELLLSKVIDTLPAFVDRVYIIDDYSTDNTQNVALECCNNDKEKLTYIRHEVNQGVGGAIATGYKEALKENIDVTVVMAGDGQMDPSDLIPIIEPIVDDTADYTKGNRLFSGDAWNIIPRVRYIGNSLLSLLTKIASGYWHVADSQSGYTAISLKTLRTIDWDKMYKRYGQPNDLLVKLNIYNFRVKDVPIKPIYGIGEKSGIKPLRMIPKLSWLLFKLFIHRMVQKYVIRDFHPLVFFYLLAFLLLPIGTIFGSYLFMYRIMIGPIEETSALFASLFIITGMQFLLFAMWFDMESNKDLK